MTPRGKGYFIWRIASCENGNVEAIADLAQQAGYTFLLIKVADGVNSYNIDTDGTDLVPPLVNTLHSHGILAWGWHYLYGNYPASEADKAKQRVNQLDLDGYALDVEMEFEDPAKDEAAHTFLDRFRSALPSFPLALCSFRYPSYHPNVPWQTFLERCDYNMPQVYWEQAHNPGEQLTRCVREFQGMSPFRPILPVGSAYKSGGWAATPSDVLTFLQTAQSLDLSAASFWEWAHTRANLPEVWNVIRNYPWSSTPPPQDITLQYLAALNTHNPDSVLSLYYQNAVHVNAARTVQGMTSIRSWFQSLFTQLLPNATFIYTAHQASGTYRHLSWTASSSVGNVYNGSDTFGLYNDKIAYHYTYFTIAS